MEASFEIKKSSHQSHLNTLITGLIKYSEHLSVFFLLYKNQESKYIDSQVNKMFPFTNGSTTQEAKYLFDRTGATHPFSVFFFKAFSGSNSLQD